MIYIEPSELRSNSKLIKCLEYDKGFFGDESRWQPLPDLEKWTGADVMVSPKESPFPSTEFKLKRFHIEKGAVLIQLKFDNDLVSSIIDGRYEEAQSRMKKVGAAPWQRLLFQVGFFYRGEDGEICSYGRSAVDVIGSIAKNFRFEHLMVAMIMWVFRGGSPLVVQTSDLIKWFEAVEFALGKALESRQRITFPRSPELYEEEIEEFDDNENWIKKEWQSLQELTLITDWRRILVTLPGIGKKKAKEIGEQYDSWLEFEGNVMAGTVEVPGVGKKTIQNIKDFIGG